MDLRKIVPDSPTIKISPGLIVVKWPRHWLYTLEVILLNLSNGNTRYEWVAARSGSIHFMIDYTRNQVSLEGSNVLVFAEPGFFSDVYQSIHNYLLWTTAEEEEAVNYPILDSSFELRGATFCPADLEDMVFANSVPAPLAGTEEPIRGD